jgi:oligopeptide/dipeptide ABC transporter ATP-binding protein
VINLLDDLQDDFGLTYVFISHDLSVVRHVSDRIAVMYLGKIVEIADSDQIFDHTRHPYTKALLSVIPVPDPDVADRREQIVLSGDVPSPIDPPSGCRFHPRCPKVGLRCSDIEPVLEPAPDEPESHQVACHYPVRDGERLTTAPVGEAEAS